MARTNSFHVFDFHLSRQRLSGDLEPDGVLGGGDESTCAAIGPECPEKLMQTRFLRAAECRDRLSGVVHDGQDGRLRRVLFQMIEERGAERWIRSGECRRRGLYLPRRKEGRGTSAES